jgi:hypothetical protein
MSNELPPRDFYDDVGVATLERVVRDMLTIED